MIELRSYQVESIEDLRTGFREGHKKQVLSAATGAGKSILALSLIQSAVEKGSRTLFVCDRRVLVDQFSAHLDRHNIAHGVLMAQHWRWRPYELVQVCSIQTLERMESWPDCDLIIIDEIHAVCRKSILSMLKNRPNLRVVGLTATPFHPELKHHFTRITNVITMKELVDDGHLVPFRVFAATEVDTKGVKISMGEWQKDELESRALRVVGDAVADYIKIYTQVWGEPRKTICFSSGVAHGTELVAKFAEHGLNFVQISYKDSDEYKAEVLREFAKDDTGIIGVISSDILTRGFDQTDIEHVIIAKPLRKSFSQHVQMVGRGARPHEGKCFAVIQDNAGNWLRFKETWDNLYHDGTKSLESDADAKARKEPTEKEKKESRCPLCKHVWPSSKTDLCPVCGFKRERKSLVSEVAGEMLELTNSPEQIKYDSATKEAWYQMMLGYCRKHRKNEGAAFHWYIKKFGVQPAWKKRYAEPSPEVASYCLSRLIAFASARK